MKSFENLTLSERRDIKTAPLYILLLAANHDGKIDEKEKENALKLAHLKSFSPDADVSDYYKEVETSFEQEMEEVQKLLPSDAAERELYLRDKVNSLTNLVNKLPEAYGKKLIHSLESFSWHISKSGRNVSDDFFIPFQIKGMNT